MLARVQVLARVGVHCDYLDDEALRSANLFSVPDISAAIAAELAAVGPDARACILPEGPQTIPYVASDVLV
jgi:hypothetical protein